LAFFLHDVDKGDGVDISEGRPSIIAPNHLQRAFTVDAPNAVWMADITCIRTWQGWLHLAVVVDLHARKAVGWSMSARLARELASDALAHGCVSQEPLPTHGRALGPRQPIRQRRLPAILSDS